MNNKETFGEELYNTYFDVTHGFSNDHSAIPRESLKQSLLNYGLNGGDLGVTNIKYEKRTHIDKIENKTKKTKFGYYIIGLSNMFTIVISHQLFSDTSFSRNVTVAIYNETNDLMYICTAPFNIGLNYLDRKHGGNYYYNDIVDFVMGMVQKNKFYYLKDKINEKHRKQNTFKFDPKKIKDNFLPYSPVDEITLMFHDDLDAKRDMLLFTELHNMLYRDDVIKTITSEHGCFHTLYGILAKCNYSQISVNVDTHLSKCSDGELSFTNRINRR